LHRAAQGALPVSGAAVAGVAQAGAVTVLSWVMVRRALGRPRSSAAMVWAVRSASFEELRLALIEFGRTYNESWLIERHGHRSPAQFRRDQMDTMPMAA
jgi:hypothetical protein